jgi:hypothetical protein
MRKRDEEASTIRLFSPDSPAGFLKSFLADCINNDNGSTLQNSYQAGTIHVVALALCGFTKGA